MKKQIIAVDIDDVLGALNEAMRHFINAKFGLGHSAADYDIEAPYWSYWERVWQVDDTEAIKRYEAFHAANTLLKTGLLPGAIDTIEALQKKYTLVVVTSRQNRFKDITHAWLDQHFPKVFKTVEFVNVWDKETPETKAEVCKATGADYLVDDNAEHCILAAQEGITGLLFGDYGWNRHVRLPKGVTRVRDWNAVKEYFDAQH